MIDSFEMIRFFTEPALSQESRFFASLRMTGEGFRMTNMVFPLLWHSLQGRGDPKVCSF